MRGLVRVKNMLIFTDRKDRLQDQRVFPQGITGADWVQPAAFLFVICTKHWLWLLWALIPIISVRI